MKRLQGKRKLEPLQRVSRPPALLGEILNAVSKLPDIDFPVPSYQALKSYGRQMFAQLLIDYPELTQAQPPFTFADYANSVLLSHYAVVLRSIARGKWKGLIEVSFVVDDEGEFHVDRDPLIVALNQCGKQHDLRHLRVCAVETCKRVFWAKKLLADQLSDPQAEVGCSDRCKNIIRVRRHRRPCDRKDSRRVARPARTAKQSTPRPALVEDVKRTLSSRRVWPNFNRSNPAHVELLAEQLEIDVDECNTVLDFIEKDKTK